MILYFTLLQGDSSPRPVTGTELYRICRAIYSLQKTADLLTRLEVPDLLVDPLWRVHQILFTCLNQLTVTERGVLCQREEDEGKGPSTNDPTGCGVGK